MSKYTADEFKHARFATHPDGRIAARIDTHDASPWGASNTTPAEGVEWYYDSDMAADGWSPLDESRPVVSYTQRLALELENAGWIRLGGAEGVAEHLVALGVRAPEDTEKENDR